MNSESGDGQGGWCAEIHGVSESDMTERLELYCSVSRCRFIENKHKLIFFSLVPFILLPISPLINILYYYGIVFTTDESIVTCS